MATDTLSDVLKTVRLTGAAYFDVVAQEPWSVLSPARELILPRILPGADHLIAYHVVTSGRAFASLDGGEAIPVEAGEVVVFTNADPHVMSSSAGMRGAAPDADTIEIAEAGLLPFHVNLMNGGTASAKLVCGYLACDARPFNPLLEALPRMLKAGDPRRNDAGWLGQFIHFAVAEVAEKRAGSESVLTKLSELMFIDVVRRYIEALPPQDTGWLAGLKDIRHRQGAVADPRAPFLQLDHRGAGTSVRNVAHGHGRALRAVGRSPADALSCEMADAGGLRDAQARQCQHGDHCRPDRLRVGGRVQSRIQEDDGRAAVGVAAGRALRDAPLAPDAVIRARRPSPSCSECPWSR